MTKQKTNWHKRKIEKKSPEIYGNSTGGPRCGNEGQDKKKKKARARIF